MPNRYVTKAQAAEVKGFRDGVSAPTELCWNAQVPAQRHRRTANGGQNLPIRVPSTTHSTAPSTPIQVA